MCVLGCVCSTNTYTVTCYYLLCIFCISCVFLCVSKSMPLYFDLSLSLFVPVTDFTESCVCVRACSRLTTLQAKLEKEIDRLSKGHVYVEAGVHVVRPGTTF
jgi:hypothetical protein